MIEVEAPDGTIVEFPQGTSLDKIKQVMRAQFPAQQQKGFGQLLKENLLGDEDPTTQNFGERVGSFLNKAGESMTAGLIGDEASAAVESLLPGLNYADRRDHYRDQERVLEENNPGAALAADIGGALVPVGGPFMLAKNANLARRVGLGASTGLGYGLVEGFAEGDHGDRVEGAVTSGLTGLGFGAATPVGLRAGSAIWNRVRDPVLSTLNVGNDRRAARALSEALERSGKTRSQVSSEIATAAAEGQSDFVMADALGNAGQRQLAGIARRPGASRTEIVEALQRRQDGQADRVAGFVEDSFGFRAAPPGTDVALPGPRLDSPRDVLRGPHRSAAQTADNLRTARGDAANVQYEAARAGAGPVDVRGALDVIDGRLVPMAGSGVKGDGIDQTLSGFRARLTASPKSLKDGEISRDLSDFDRVLGVKQDVQDARGAAVRAGRNNEARLLKDLEVQLDAALEGASEGYRAANDTFRETSRVIDAVESGENMARPGARATDTTKEFASMTPDQQAAARVGYGDKLLTKVEGAAGPGTNRARPLTSPKSEAERSAMALDPDRLRRRIDRENVMFETNRQALGGSQTADNLADMTESAGFDASAIGNILMGNFRTGAAQLTASLGQALKGQNEETRQLIARALLSRDPQAVLKKAAQQRGSDETSRALAQAILTAGGISAFSP